MEKLKIIRKKLKLTQLEVAKQLNITQSCYGFYESGRSEPDIKTLIKLSNLYNVSIDELLGNDKFVSTEENSLIVPAEKKEVVSQLLALSDQHFKFIATEIQTCFKLSQAF